MAKTFQVNDNPVDNQKIIDLLNQARSLEPGSNRQFLAEKETIKKFFSDAEGKNRAGRYREARELLNQGINLLNTWTAPGNRKSV